MTLALVHSIFSSFLSYQLTGYRQGSMHCPLSSLLIHQSSGTGNEVGAVKLLCCINRSDSRKTALAYGTKNWGFISELDEATSHKILGTTVSMLNV